MNRSLAKTLFLAISATGLAVSLIAFPVVAFNASLRGLDMWWRIVFPSLLPFFIVSELLIGFGVVRFIGVLLEPLMRPIFRVPGAGGFVWAMGMASGFPSGAKLTARLRQERQISQIEAERLVSFTNSSNPLFIFSAVSVGFFNNVHIGVILALSHYIGNIFVGVVMRFYGAKEDRQIRYAKQTLSIRSAILTLHQTRLNDQRPFGKLLGDAVMSSIQTLLMIGGFIILFSVLNAILLHIQITTILAIFITYIFSLFQLPSALSAPFISGLFEITLGSQLTSKTSVALMYQVTIVSFLLAFSGFSVQAQVASILAQTDIRFKPFFIARILHGFFAAIISWILWKPVYQHYFGIDSPLIIPVFKNTTFNIPALMDTFLTIGPLVTIIFLIGYVFLYYYRNFLKKG
ncbi:sporulation integral membrane protein YlbJ [Bacillus sp. 2205SS5-2]|uniref:sporulation integral membrane protein YlbJ n=1 Tax=Bacillus sp. 2205SS5-2 TaxID=3109031 RepID=UPI0030056F82